MGIRKFQALDLLYRVYNEGCDDKKCKRGCGGAYGGGLTGSAFGGTINAICKDNGATKFIKSLYKLN
jgi:galactokinase